MALRLNLGGGADPACQLPAEDGWVVVDRKSGGEVFPLNYADASVEELRCSHILEHVPHGQIAAVLKEWARVLKPGGRIRIAVPDFAYIAQQYVAGNRNEPLVGYLMGGQTDANDFHYAALDEPTLRTLMEDAGLRRIRPWVSDLKDCAALPVSLNLEGYKAEPLRTMPDTVAVLSRPRLGFQNTFDCLHRVLSQLQIPLLPGDGVFWDIVMQNLFENVLASNAKYILAIDYDSVFTAENVAELYRVMESRPDIDALCPLQIRRDSNAALIVMKDANGSHRSQADLSEFQQDVTKVDSGAFGLTLIRTASLRDLPKPWFLHKPDAAGQWGPDGVHADVSFWHKWRDAGKTLYMANYCSIGHLELQVRWIGRDMQPISQKLREWSEDGVPMEVAR